MTPFLSVGIKVHFFQVFVVIMIISLLSVFVYIIVVVLISIFWFGILIYCGILLVLLVLLGCSSFAFLKFMYSPFCFNLFIFYSRINMVF